MSKNKMILKRKRIVAILFILSLFYLPNFSYALGEEYVEMKGVSVFIGTEKIRIEDKFYNSEGRLLIPLRDLLEKLGADVEWVDSSRSVIATLGDRKVELSIDSNKASVDDKTLDLSVSPMIIDSKTYIPLRFVSESLGYRVKWNPDSRIITIGKATKVSGASKGIVFASSKTFNEEYINIEVKNRNRIYFEGRAPENTTDWCFNIKKKGESDKSCESAFEKFFPIKDQCYESSYSLEGVEDGRYRLMVYFREAGEEEYLSYYDNIGLICENGFWRIDIPEVYENNCKKYEKGRHLNPNDYLALTFQNEGEENKIKEIATELTAGAESDYEKLKRINDYLAKNLYYDWDCYLGGCGQVERETVEIINSKKAVCAGYADIAQKLMRASGIPSRLVNGHVIWYYQDWDDVDHSKINHVWNEAYVDGRWVTVDVTWNSTNVYKQGAYHEGRVKHLYFDPDLLAFSATHKIIECK